MKGFYNMSIRLKDCLTENIPNRLYPFLIIHDESRDDLAEEIEAIYNSGSGGFCVENRGHKDFGGERWWSDIGLILEEAKKRGMKVWLGDDESFPTGAANWALRDKYPERKRWLLAADKMDVIGPGNVGALVGNFLKDGEKLFAVIAYKRTLTDSGEIYEKPVNLTDKVKDGVLFWDAPEGLWRLFIMVKTQVRCPEHYMNYIDMIDPESCKLMIEEVYEPHYQHFKEYFGNTLEAFFTDEPAFENFTSFSYNFKDKLGTDTVLLPWRDDLVKMIADEESWTEEETLLNFAAFWEDVGGNTPVIRRRYMDLITRLYSENFTHMLGNWCREHGVLYTGHIIEDNNAHMRFGCSCGHFFRSMEGQDIAGFDLVLQQLMPGNRNQTFRSASSGKYLDNDFYLYTLGRLAASQGHLYPHMKGRVMCECAGANGWAEGLSAKKYFLDAMLVGGGNIMITGVHDPRRDNPHLPTFVYDHGENLQYPYWKPLMQYTNRICHLLSDGVHRANALIFYPAEADWCGEAMTPDKVAAPLALSHIDYDFAPWDLLKGDSVKVKDGKLSVADETFDALIVPKCEYLPEEILKRFDELGWDVPVIFADGLAKSSETKEIFLGKNLSVMSVGDIIEWFKRNSFVDFQVDGAEDLMHIHISHPDSETYFFFNTSLNAIDTVAKFRYTGDYAVYDAWDNTAVKRTTPDGNVRLIIPPKGTLILIFGATEGQDGETRGEVYKKDWLPFDVEFDVKIKDYNDTDWKDYKKLKSGELINLAPELTRFAGTLMYSAKVDVSGVKYINLGEVGEIAEVTINGKQCGVGVTAPYIFDVSGAWKDGENELLITVAANCAYRKRDNLSTTMQLPPTGLIGPVTYIKSDK